MASKASERDKPAGPPAVIPPVGTGLIGWLLERPGAFRRRLLIGYWTGIFLLTHWPSIDDLPGARWLPEHFDQFVHACLYGGWAVLWWWVLAGRRGVVARRALGWLLIGGAAYGVFDELTQSIVGRTPDVLDWVADVSGMVVGILLLRWWLRRKLAAAGSL